MPRELMFAVLALGGLVMLYATSRLAHRAGPVFAACVVIASSTYSLLTTAPGSASFLFHAVLLVVVSVVLLFGFFRKRSAGPSGTI